jgi:tetraacyldisaccharide 4'-kinase
VGNISWGGTGKTPLVASLANMLLKQGRKPAVLIRGYGRDEEALFSGLAPGVRVMAGRDRVKNAKALLAESSLDTILLDDGFQYRRLKRDFDIVCIDVTDPLGNNWLIPAGSMREGLSSLKRADVLLLTRVDLAEDNKVLEGLEDKLKKINPHALIAKAVHRPRYFYRLSDNNIVEIEQLKNRHVVLVSAIGNPNSFEKTISTLGLRFKKHFIFRDHHWYTEKDLKKIENYCIKHKIEMILTTEKDAIRFKAMSYELSAISFLILRIDLKIIDNEQGFYNRLLGIYNS